MLPTLGGRALTVSCCQSWTLWDRRVIPFPAGRRGEQTGAFDGPGWEAKIPIIGRLWRFYRCNGFCSELQKTQFSKQGLVNSAECAFNLVTRHTKLLINIYLLILCATNNNFLYLPISKPVKLGGTNIKPTSVVARGTLKRLPITNGSVPLRRVSRDLLGNNVISKAILCLRLQGPFLMDESTPTIKKV